MTATDPQPTLEEVLEDLAKLGHPLRVRILLELERGGKASPNDLAGDRTEDNPRGLGANLGTVAYHVRVLKVARYVTLAGEVRRRGAIEHYYRITAAGRRTIAGVSRLALQEASA